MNDEIDEFIKQATKEQAFYPACNDGHPEHIVYFDKRLFAELIISKCATIAEEVDGDSIVKHCILVYFGVKA